MICRHIQLLVFLSVLELSTSWGQTFVSPAGVQYQVNVLANGLQQPSAMVFLPDGRALLVERRSAKIDLIDLKSGSLTALDGGFEPLIGLTA